MLILLLFIPSQVFGQAESTQSGKKSTSSYQDFFQTHIKNLLPEPHDTTVPTILHLVQDHCRQDPRCMVEVYQLALTDIKLGNDFWLGVPIAEEILRLGEAKQDTQLMTLAYERLLELHGFLGNSKPQNESFQKLLLLYKQLGDSSNYYMTQFMVMEGRAWTLGDIDETLAELEEVRAEVKKLHLEDIANNMLIRLKYLYEENGKDAAFEHIVEELEKLPLSDPPKKRETSLAFHRASGRADLLLKEGKYDEALKYYQQAREYVRPRYGAFHDTWLDIYALHRLARLEWMRGRSQEATAWLDSAFALSHATKMFNRLIINLERRIEIAEAEKRFEDALRYTREMQRYQDSLDSRNAGFDEKRFQLELVKERLTASNEKQALELQLKDNRLRNAFIVAALSLLLMLGLFLALRKQWRDRKTLAAQHELIKRQTEELKKLDAAKSRFFANVSHELRTPLSLMLGPIKSVLNDEPVSDKQKQLLTLADQNGKQLQRLINEILDLRKLEVDSLELHMEPTELHHFFSRHTAQFESLADQQKIAYSFDISLDKTVLAPIDKQKCEQVLNNLLANAFKFTPKGAEIKVKVFLRENQLHISVRDTGEGIHPDDLPHIFDRYFQTKDPEKPVAGGTGIGLALCKEYARLFGGDLTVESTLMRGSTFSFSFPIVIQPHEVETVVATSPIVEFEPQQQYHSPASRPSNKPAILIVEDNVDLQRYLHLILSDSYAIHIAGNGQEALDYLQTTPTCELILSDIMMPVMDGYQLLQEVKGDDRYRHIPVIMLTARADMRDKLRALRIGVDDYLLKPFDEEELRVRMANLLAHQEARKEMLASDVSAEKPDPLLPEEDKIWLEQFEAYCKQHYSSDILNVPDMAAEFAMSESTLLRQVKRITGLTPSQYINEIRLDKARQLLENRAYNSIAKVGYKVGFTNTSTFSRAFKKRFGKNPSFLLSA